jgi:ubiquitin carboxyl-terminal hydrolase L5
MSDGWCTIESDPAVFTEILENLGVQGLEVAELVALDQSFLDELGQLHGLILLFKWAPVRDPRPVSDDPSIYFAKQVVQNACATQAILNILLNRADTVTLGPTIGGFLEFTQALDPHTRGEMVGQSEDIRKVHNAFARPAAFSFEDRHAKGKEDVYHFVAFTHKNGAIWELDGLKDGPIKAADAAGGSGEVQQKMIEVVQARIQELVVADTSGAGQGISFTLLAVIDDRVAALETQMAILQSADQPAEHLLAALEQRQMTRAKGKLENVRRRHNYIPMIVALLTALQEKQQLDGAVEKAKLKAAEQQTKKQNAGK